MHWFPQSHCFCHWPRLCLNSYQKLTNRLDPTCQHKQTAIVEYIPGLVEWNQPHGSTIPNPLRIHAVRCLRVMGMWGLNSNAMGTRPPRRQHSYKGTGIYSNSSSSLSLHWVPTSRICNSLPLCQCGSGVSTQFRPCKVSPN